MPGPLTFRVLAALALLAVIAALRLAPWRTWTQASGEQREKLTVGFLPVT